MTLLPRKMQPNVCRAQVADCKWKTACVAMLFGPRINSKYLDESGYFLQMVKGFAHGFVLAPQHIHVEHVLPRLAPDRTGFNFAQVKIAQQALSDTQIRAPFDGRVADKPTQAGTVASPVGWRLRRTASTW